MNISLVADIGTLSRSRAIDVTPESNSILAHEVKLPDPFHAGPQGGVGVGAPKLVLAVNEKLFVKESNPEVPTTSQTIAPSSVFVVLEQVLVAQGVGQLPPQSTPVSVPFCMKSLQEGGNSEILRHPVISLLLPLDCILIK